MSASSAGGTVAAPRASRATGPASARSCAGDDGAPPRAAISGLSSIASLRGDQRGKRVVLRAARTVAATRVDRRACRPRRAAATSAAMPFAQKPSTAPSSAPWRPPCRRKRRRPRCPAPGRSARRARDRCRLGEHALQAVDRTRRRADAQALQHAAGRRASRPGRARTTRNQYMFCDSAHSSLQPRQSRKA